jgi:peptidoglycan/LPS O-acetylase OafA/YrhL
MKTQTPNNFDLIRLFAATQVAIQHITYHFGFDNYLLSALNLFPGVPIFFFISGFLIYGSYAKSKENLKPNINFFLKRFLRIYPALYLCVALSLLSVYQSGYLRNLEFHPGHFIAWVASQVTFVQFYNPEFMRGYGVGVMNGSLWTISVEIQFYLLTPLLFLFIKKANIKLVGFVLAALICVNILNTNPSVISIFFNDQFNAGTNLYKKIFNVTFLPWFYTFVLGAVIYKFDGFINLVKKINFFALLLLYGACYLFTEKLGWQNNINPIAYAVLILLILKCAYTLPNVSDNLLKRNDISYGIYIFHMPILNYLLYKNISGLNGVLIALFFTFTLSILSWFLLEKRVLAMKTNSHRKI